MDLSDLTNIFYSSLGKTSTRSAKDSVSVVTEKNEEASCHDRPLMLDGLVVVELVRIEHCSYLCSFLSSL